MNGVPRELSQQIVWESHGTVLAMLAFPILFELTPPTSADLATRSAVRPCEELACGVIGPSTSNEQPGVCRDSSDWDG